jgi:protein tyrosine/serine phosphatase
MKERSNQSFKKLGVAAQAILLAGTGMTSLIARADAGAQPLTIPITAFRTVSDGIYRGARPLHAGMEALAQQLAIKTDLDLENDGSAIADEQKDAQALGIRMISLPMSGFFAPSDSTVNQALAILKDPANYPVFVHCQHGEDRTGLIVGLFRVEVQGMSPADAYAEMKADGFHPILLGLNHYFEERTGFED